MPRTPDLSKWTYEKMFERLIEESSKNVLPQVTHSLRLYHETHFGWASDNVDDAEIAVWHHDILIASLLPGQVMVHDTGADRGTWGHSNPNFSNTTKRRLDWLLQANCDKRLVSIRRSLKVYIPTTGGYDDFRAGAWIMSAKKAK